MQIETLLIANRGEIACRVMATAKRLGITTVAVYSDVDKHALHVKTADMAVSIGPALATESYLSVNNIVRAAIDAGADAIHPGYGFLSENPGFVDACESAGLIFVGPSAAAMRAMGLKDAAKTLMAAAGVPIVPGYHGSDQSIERLQQAATDVGYPVLIKARAGGGGKGMRLVEKPEGFSAALQSAKREAASSFADDAVLIEKFIQQPRHIEVQVFGDQHGQLVHLFERDCSLQRRHQKVIEEAPAPGMSDAVRSAMTEAALTAARTVDYVGAGTVEFIADGSGSLRADGFWFMEMNTRLQVEHPVTEAITGFDLVEWQLRIAAGEPLPVSQSGISLSGHAMEARLYAEDPSNGFLPATGTLERLQFSDVGRIDSGVVEGDQVLPHYDPMLAKFVAHGATREAARLMLGRMLADTVILGTISNREFLWQLSRHPRFVEARLDTGLIEQELSSLLSATETLVDNIQVHPLLQALAAISLVAQPLFKQASQALVEPGFWQLWGQPERLVVLLDGDQRVEAVVVARHADLWQVTLNRPKTQVPSKVILLRADSGFCRNGSGEVTLASVTRRAESVVTDAQVLVQYGPYACQLRRDSVEFESSSGHNEGTLRAPMPGRVIAVNCQVGDAVDAGQTLVTLEAMKMEHSLTATSSATVESIGVQHGDQVDMGAELINLSTG
ncbi:MAG: biotin carboxylase N-terminal domain-containing protein [Granulosicoccus sp.]